jgi:ABC-type multidrug transport system fused ATPase/permease subunit
MSNIEAPGAEKALASSPWRGMRAVYKIMQPRRRMQLLGTMVLMLLGAVAELVTIGAVLPLLALAADPNYFSRVPAAKAALDFIGAKPGDNLIIPAATLLVVASIASAALRSALTWASNHFVYGLGYDISTRVFGRLLRQPYELYVRQNSSAALSAVEKINLVSAAILAPGLLAFTSAVISLCIISFLFVIDPVTAAIATVSVGVMYVSISLVSKRAIFRNSRRSAEVRTHKLKVVQESWGGMRDIILDHSQPIFERKISGYDDEMRRLQVQASFILEAPRFAVESSGIIVVALLAVYFSWQPGGVLAAIPVLGGLALGAQRMLPLVQAVYRGWASYSINAYALRDVLDLMEAPVSGALSIGPDANPLPASLAVEVRDLWFGYSAEEQILKGINLNIRPGERVAFIGKTGSGKSTLVDVLMGLLPPTKGQILLNGAPLDDATIKQWQARISHVPQVIFLSDDTIAANIAFGTGAETIDMARVRHAAERADIRAFVEQLPEGFQTTVGERGIRLSGGQRQRIGIARALYKNATVLVLDEATSALDAATEAAVMESVAGLDRDLTVILIAHRLSTVAGCDTIYRLESGRITQSGTYAEVVGASGAAETAPAA